MDIEKLIEDLRVACAGNQHNIMGVASAALSTLQAENAQLRGELEYEQEHANAYYEECGQWEAENEKLRAELEKVKRCIEIVENQRDQMKRERDAAIDCIYKIGDALDRGNDNDWAREHISEWESQKEG